MSRSDFIGRDEAARVALAAQGFGASKGAPVTRRALQALVERLGCVQIDSVNVLVRSHYLPAFSRLGSYDRAVLDDLAYGSRRVLAEYWAHEASLVTLDRWPLLRWRMQRARAGIGMWRNVARVAREQTRLVDSVRMRIEREGPLPASAFEDAKGEGSWWGWSETKRALEYLFWAGFVTTRRRRASFEREYDLVERVIPKALLDIDVSEDDAHDALILCAARALGIASEIDLRDYFRLDVASTRAALARMLERGDLAALDVEGWRGPGYYVPPLRIPRRALGSTVLSPFDNLIWNRTRAARLFGFEYRLEIYTQKEKRVHGYYVLPYLCDGKLVARIDLKSDRARGALVAHAIHLEGHAKAKEVTPRLRADLTALAEWLELERVEARFPR